MKQIGPIVLRTEIEQASVYKKGRNALEFINMFTKAKDITGQEAKVDELTSIKDAQESIFDFLSRTVKLAEKDASTLGYMTKGSYISTHALMPENTLEINFDNKVKDLAPVDKRGYSREKMGEYLNFMEEFQEGNGTIYEFDVETMGYGRRALPVNGNPGSNDASKQYFAITEASVVSSQMIDGELNSTRQVSFNSQGITSKASLSADEIEEVITKIHKSEDQSMTKVMLERLAGYNGNSKEGSVIFSGGANITNNENIKGGIEALLEFDHRESEAYKDNFSDLIVKLHDIGKKKQNGENVMISTRNGSAFDFPQLYSELLSSDIGEDIQAKVSNTIGYPFVLDEFATLMQESSIDNLVINKMYSDTMTQNQLGSPSNVYNFKMDHKAEELRSYYTSIDLDDQKVKDLYDKIGFDIGEVKSTFDFEVANQVHNMGGYDPQVIKTIMEDGVENYQHTGEIDTIIQTFEAERMFTVIKEEVEDYVEGFSVNIAPFSGSHFEHSVEGSAFVSDSPIIANKRSMAFNVQGDNQKKIYRQTQQIMPKDTPMTVELLTGADIKEALTSGVKGTDYTQAVKDSIGFVGNSELGVNQILSGEGILKDESVVVVLTELTKDDKPAQKAIMMYDDLDSVSKDLFREDRLFHKLETKKELNNYLEVKSQRDFSKKMKDLKDPSSRMNLKEIEDSIFIQNADSGHLTKNIEHRSKMLTVIGEGKDVEKFNSFDRIKSFLEETETVRIPEPFTRQDIDNGKLFYLLGTTDKKETFFSTIANGEDGQVKKDISEFFERGIFAVNGVKAEDIVEELSHSVDNAEAALIFRKYDVNINSSYNAMPFQNANDIKAGNSYIFKKGTEIKQFKASEITAIQSANEFVQGSEESLGLIIDNIKDAGFSPTEKESKLLLNTMIEGIQEDYVKSLSQDDKMEALFLLSAHLREERNKIPQPQPSDRYYQEVFLQEYGDVLKPNQLEKVQNERLSKGYLNNYLKEDGQKEFTDVQKEKIKSMQKRAMSEKGKADKMHKRASRQLLSEEFGKNILTSNDVFLEVSNDLVESEKLMRDFTKLTVRLPNNEFRHVSISESAVTQKDLSITAYSLYPKDRNTIAARDVGVKDFIRDTAKDFEDRGLITSEQVSNVFEVLSHEDSIPSIGIELLSDAVHENTLDVARNIVEFDEYMGHLDYTPPTISKFIENYNEGNYIHKDPAEVEKLLSEASIVDNLFLTEYTEKNALHIGNTTLDEQLSTITNKNGMVKNEYIKGKLDAMDTFSDDYKRFVYDSKGKYNAKEVSEELAKLQEHLGYTDENMFELKKIAENPVFSKGVSLEGETPVHVGLAVSKTDDGASLLLYTDRDQLLGDLSKTKHIEDFKENHMVINLPKREEGILGGTFISQSKYSRIAVNDTIAVTSDGANVTFRQVDNITEGISVINSDIRYASQAFVGGNISQANSRANRGLSTIRENKSFNADNYIKMYELNKDGKAEEVIKYVQGSNLADVTKSHNAKTHQLILALPEVLEANEELASRFRENVSSTSLSRNGMLMQDLHDKVSDVIATQSNYRGTVDLKTKKFLEIAENPEISLFFKSNFPEIAQTMLEAKDSLGNQKYADIKEYLQDAVKAGGVGVQFAKTGDAKGANINTKFHEMVFMSEYYNFSRGETASQYHSSKAMHLGTVDAYNAKYLDFGEAGPTLFDIKDEKTPMSSRYKGALTEGGVTSTFNYAGIKPGASIINYEAHENIEKAYKKSLELYEEGFYDITAPVKLMTSEEYFNKVSSLLDPQSQARKDIISQIQQSQNISYESAGQKVDEIAKKHFGVSLYEDSSLISNKLSPIQTESSVKNLKIDSGSVAKVQKGDLVEKGDVIGFKDSKPVIATHNGVVGGIEDGSVLVSISAGSKNMKINIGENERSMGTLIDVSNMSGSLKENETILDAVQDYLLDGAVIGANPGIAKHDALSLVVTPRIINISDNIHTQEGADLINSIYSKHSDIFDISVTKDTQKSVVLGEDTFITTFKPKSSVSGQDLVGRGPLDEWQKIEAEILNLTEGTKLKEDISKGISRITDDNVITVNVANASFNMLDSSNGIEGAKGSSFGVRRLAAQMDTGSIKDSLEGSLYMSTATDKKWILDSVLDNKEELAEVQNIMYAYMQNETGVVPSKAVVSDRSLKTISIAGGQINASDLDEIFNPSAMPGVNMVRIDLGNQHIKKPKSMTQFTTDEIANLRKRGFDDIADNIGKEYISELYIPLISANKVGDSVNLAELQKSSADLISSVLDIKNSTGNRTIDRKIDTVTQRYESYMDALKYEIVDDKGKLKQLLNTKEIPFSGRNLNQSVLNAFHSDPITKTATHPVYGTILEEYKDGFRYHKREFINPVDLKERYGVEFSSIGIGVINEPQFMKESMQVDLIKRANKDIDLSGVNTMKEMTARFNVNKEEFNLDSIGKLFMEEEGIEALSGRAPFMRVDSDTYVNLRVSDTINPGTSVIDHISSVGQKLDTDGDKSELLLISLKGGSDGSASLRSIEDELRNNARKGSFITDEAQIQMYNDAVKDASTYTDHLFDTYAEKSRNYTSIVGRKSVNPTLSEVTYGAAVANSKVVIGQASNPGLFLSSGGQAYLNVLQDASAEKLLDFGKTIGAGSQVVEQFAIDQKLLSGIDDGGQAAYQHLQNMKKMQGVYNSLYHATDLDVSGREVKLRKSLHEAIDVLSPHAVKVQFENVDGKRIAYDFADFQEGIKTQIHKESLVIDGNIFNKDGVIKSDIKGKIVDKIISHETLPTDNRYAIGVDHFLSNITEMFSNQDVRDSYASIYTNVSVGRNLNKVGPERIVDELSNGVSENTYYSNVMDVLNGGNISSGLHVNIGDEQVPFAKGMEISVTNQGGVLPIGNYKVDEVNFYRGSTETILQGLNGETQPISILSATQEDLDDMLKGVNFSDELLHNDEIIKQNASKQIKDSFFDKRYNEIDNIIEQAHIPANVQAELKSESIGLASDVRGALHRENALTNFVNQEVMTQTEARDLLDQMNEDIIRRGAQSRTREQELLMDSDVGKRLAETLGGDSKAVIDSYMSNDQTKSHAQDITNQFLETVSKEAPTSELGDDALSLITRKWVNDKENFVNLESLHDTVGKDLDFAKSILRNRIGEDTSAQRSKEIIEGFQYLSNRDTFKRSVENFHQIEELTAFWDGKSQLVKFKHLSNDQIHKLLNTDCSVQGINEDFLRMYQSKVSNYLSGRLKENQDATAVVLDEVYDTITKNNEFRDMLDKINEDIVARGAEPKLNTKTQTGEDLAEKFVKAKASAGEFTQKTSQFISKHKVGVAVAAAVGLGAIAYTGHNIRKAKKGIYNREEENKHINQQTNIPHSQKIYIEDRNSINVNVRAKQRNGGGIQKMTSTLSSAFGDQVSLNSRFTDDRRTLHDNEIDDIMASNLY